MPKNRVARVVSAVAAANLLLAATAPAADAPKTLVGTLNASVTPNKNLHKPPANGFGTPIKLKIDNKFQQPPGTTFVLKSLDYEFPKGAVTNGKIFPSCTVAKIVAAHGNLKACPKGSQIGSGVATGTAVALDPPVTSTGAIALFNGPGGKSIVMNINVVRPAAINATFSSPLKKVSGKFGYKLTISVPPSLQSILDGPIVVRRIQATTFATATIKGKKRGYIEAKSNACPKSGKLPISAHFFFTDANTNVDATSTTNSNIKCIP